MKTPTKGYKVTNPDFTCNLYQYELGKIFKHQGKLKLCSSGFEAITSIKI